MAKNDDLDEHVQREMNAMKVIYAALRKLDASAQQWVIRCVMDRLGLGPAINTEQKGIANVEEIATRPDLMSESSPRPPVESVGIDGISPAASKWMIRNEFTAANLSSLYSLGLDEIDLVVKSVPGASKKDRMRSVLLLQGVASYLSTGVSRMNHDKVKEACVHYDAFDTANFARHLKGFSREVGGTRDSGYMLTAAGLAAATEMIKDLGSGGSGDSMRSSSRKKAKR